MSIYSYTHGHEDLLRYYGDRAQRTLDHLELAPMLDGLVTGFTPQVNEMRDRGLVTLRSVFRRSETMAVNSAARLLVANRKHLGRVRNHEAESAEDIQAGRFAYYDAESLPSVHLETVTSSVNISQPLVAIPALSKIVFDTELLGIAAAYLEAIPVISYAKLTTSFPNDIPEVDTQLWHADYGSYRIVKAIVYLTDASPNNGPFSYAVQSHRRRFDGWDKQSRFTDEDIQGHYQTELCLGLAGDVIIADTTGFHRGLKPLDWPRRVVIITYCVHPEYGFTYTPIKLPRATYEQLAPFPQAAASAMEIVET